MTIRSPRAFISVRSGARTFRGARSDLERLSAVMFLVLSVFTALQTRGVLNPQGRAIDRPRRSIELRFQAVSRQVRDGDHYEAVCFAELDQVRNAGHGSVVVDNLADHARRLQAREVGEIDGRL